jgi:hypothetical protein
MHWSNEEPNPFLDEEITLDFAPVELGMVSFIFQAVDRFGCFGIR